MNFDFTSPKYLFNNPKNAFRVLLRLYTFHELYVDCIWSNFLAKLLIFLSLSCTILLLLLLLLALYLLQQLLLVIQQFCKCLLLQMLFSCKLQLLLGILLSACLDIAKYIPTSVHSPTKFALSLLLLFRQLLELLQFMFVSPF